MILEPKLLGSDLKSSSCAVLKTRFWMLAFHIFLHLYELFLCIVYFEFVFCDSGDNYYFVISDYYIILFSV